MKNTKLSYKEIKNLIWPEELEDIDAQIKENNLNVKEIFFSISGESGIGNNLYMYVNDKQYDMTRYEFW
jgi:hypothetical protein